MNCGGIEGTEVLKVLKVLKVLRYEVLNTRGIRSML